MNHLGTYVHISKLMFQIFHFALIPKFNQNCSTPNNRFDNLIDPKSSQTKIFQHLINYNTTIKRSLSKQTLLIYEPWTALNLNDMIHFLFAMRCIYQGRRLEYLNDIWDMPIQNVCFHNLQKIYILLFLQRELILNIVMYTQ